jgi:hypothetical protein
MTGRTNIRVIAVPSPHVSLSSSLIDVHPKSLRLLLGVTDMSTGGSERSTV